MYLCGKAESLFTTLVGITDYYLHIGMTNYCYYIYGVERVSNTIKCLLTVSFVHTRWVFE
jgi:hypothetical protein